MDIALFSPLSVVGAVALVLGLIVSVVAAGWLVERRRRRGLAGGGGRAALLAVGGTLAVAMLVSAMEDAVLELNPAFTNSELAGAWRHGRATLTLGPDGGYSCAPTGACGQLGAGGQWERREDFELVFRPPDGPEHVERVVTFGAEFRLTEMGEIDLWNRELTFRHPVPPS